MRAARAMLVSLALAALGCSSDVDAARSRLQAARSQWARTPHASYQYLIAIHCFCPQRVARVNVVNGATVSVVDTISGAPIAPAAINDLTTMEAVFDQLKADLNRGPEEFTIDYDPATGHPTHASFDFSLSIADEEVAYSITMESLTP